MTADAAAPGITIRRATSDADLAEVRRLMRAFVPWLHALYPDDRAGVDANFATLDAELDALPGAFAPPGGCLLLATCDGVDAGVVAFRDLDGGACEMKRLFVDPAFHGRGIGRALATRLVAEARTAGYTRMRLDTGDRQVGALGLYRSLGFREIAPYGEGAQSEDEHLVYLELAL